MKLRAKLFGTIVALALGTAAHADQGYAMYLIGMWENAIPTECSSDPECMYNSWTQIYNSYGAQYNYLNSMFGSCSSYPGGCSALVDDRETAYVVASYASSKLVN